MPQFRVAGLVAGDDSNRRLDIPVMIWLLKGNNGRRVLIDSGFYRQKFLDQWKPTNFRSPAAAVALAGVKPDEITHARRRRFAQTLDPARNLKAQDRIRTLASHPSLIVPGHDPAVFERFPMVGEGVVRTSKPRRIAITDRVAVAARSVLAVR